MDELIMAILVFVLDLSSLSFRIGVDFYFGIGYMQHCNLEVAVLVVAEGDLLEDDYYIAVFVKVEDSSAAAVVVESDKIVEQEVDNLLAADSSFEMAVEEDRAYPVPAELSRQIVVADYYYYYEHSLVHFDDMLRVVEV